MNHFNISEIYKKNILNIKEIHLENKLALIIGYMSVFQLMLVGGTLKVTEILYRTPDYKKCKRYMMQKVIYLYTEFFQWECSTCVIEQIKTTVSCQQTILHVVVNFHALHTFWTLFQQRWKSKFTEQ